MLLQLLVFNRMKVLQQIPIKDIPYHCRKLFQKLQMQRSPSNIQAIQRTISPCCYFQASTDAEIPRAYIMAQSWPPAPSSLVATMASLPEYHEDPAWTLASMILSKMAPITLMFPTRTNTPSILHSSIGNSPTETFLEAGTFPHAYVQSERQPQLNQQSQAPCWIETYVVCLVVRKTFENERTCARKRRQSGSGRMR